MKTNENQTEKYITSVRKYLKEKYGRIKPEWKQPLQILQDNLQVYEECKETIERDGLMLKAKNGAWTKHPLIKVSLDAQVQITKYLAEFGLTPKSASKISLLDDEEDDALKDLLGD